MWQGGSRQRERKKEEEGILATEAAPVSCGRRLNNKENDNKKRGRRAWKQRRRDRMTEGKRAVSGFVGFKEEEKMEK